MVRPQVTAPRPRTIAPLPSLLALAVVMAAMGWAIVFSIPGAIVLSAAYGLPGLILALRLPRQPIAWLLLLLGIAFALGPTVPTESLDELVARQADTLGQLTVWAGFAGWVLFFIGFLGILLTFPAGTLAGGRWRVVSVALIVAYLVIGGLLLVGPTVPVDVPGTTISIMAPNPLGLPLVYELIPVAVGESLFGFLVAGQFVALLVALARFRRSTGLERLQFRWLGLAAAVVVLGTAAWGVTTQVLQTEISLLPGIIVGLTWPWFPIAVVVAVLRYRLYEIDRLVSRTIGWALATATIVGVFVAGVLALSALLGGLAQGQSVATAAATLLAFALFHPLRSRLQRLVDRRFDRPRIEAERTLRRYGEQLAHEVELGVIEGSVIQTVASTVRPASVSLWIRPLGNETPR